MNNNNPNASTPKVWLITGASRGLGASIANAVLAAGHKVVATGRNVESVEKALGGANENLLVLELDVTNEAQATAIGAKVVEHFGRIDILVNNAGYGLFGTLEESTTKQIETQFQTNVFGLISVTRSVLPFMREQRSGHIMNLSSIGGFVGFTNASLYCATKFAVEGISESLAMELEPFGIHVTSIEPGYFRTDFLTGNSLERIPSKIADYDNGSYERVADHDGTQPGDPEKLAQAVLILAASENPPVRLPLGPDAVGLVEKKLESVKAELAPWRELAISTNFDE